MHKTPHLFGDFIVLDMTQNLNKLSLIHFYYFFSNPHIQAWKDLLMTGCSPFSQLDSYNLLWTFGIKKSSLWWGVAATLTFGYKEHRTELCWFSKVVVDSNIPDLTRPRKLARFLMRRMTSSTWVGLKSQSTALGCQSYVIAI